MSLSDSSPLEVAKAASVSARSIAILPAQARNDALTTIHAALSAAKETILVANAQDIVAAKRAADDGRLSQTVVKRLDLSRPGKWEDMLKGILDVRDLEDPSKSLEQCICAINSSRASYPEELYLGRSDLKSKSLKGAAKIKVGKTTLKTRLDEGLELERVTAPIGVLLIIFEARPEVIANIASLAIKSGNAAILKGVAH